jgi:hypothetical protein
MTRDFRFPITPPLSVPESAEIRSDRRVDWEERECGVSAAVGFDTTEDGVLHPPEEAQEAEVGVGLSVPAKLLAFVLLATFTVVDV